MPFRFRFTGGFLRFAGCVLYLAMTLSLAAQPAPSRATTDDGRAFSDMLQDLVEQCGSGCGPDTDDAAWRWSEEGGTSLIQLAARVTDPAW
ncbi:MAG: hypothetical protein U5J83_12940 [Bryobacterales bacterium]|nr:hypothetical protein [Bryobacterales bacterium]